MAKVDDEILAEVIKFILKRDEFADADERTLIDIMDIIEDSIKTYTKLAQTKVKKKYKKE